MSGTDTGPVADAVRGGWVDTLAPARARPYLRLMRVDRPIGTWLVLWPGWWSVALAGVSAGARVPDLWLIALFGIGAIIMRGAGCTYNDIIDRDFDRHVARTRSRPIPSGQVTVKQAWVLAFALSLAGLAVLLQFNPFAIIVGAASLLIVAAYPFMKRITWWPQFVLGLAFNWGALLGWAAVTGRIDPAAVVLYVGGIFWTLAYDTIYALQDQEDDALIGVKSTARVLGHSARFWIAVFMAAATVLFAGSAYLAGAGWLVYAGIAAGAAHFAWQIRMLEPSDPARCLMLFRANRDYGWILFAGIVASGLAPGPL